MNPKLERSILCSLSWMLSSKFCIAKRNLIVPHHRTTGPTSIEYVWISCRSLLMSFAEFQFSSDCFSLVYTCLQRHQRSAQPENSETLIALWSNNRPVCKRSEHITQNECSWVLWLILSNIRTDFFIHLSKPHSPTPPRTIGPSTTSDSTPGLHWPATWHLILGEALKSEPVKFGWMINGWRQHLQNEKGKIVDMRPLGSYQTMDMNSLLPDTMISSC